MFRRRKNRKRRSLRDRLRGWFDRCVELGRRVGPYLLLAAVAVAIPYLVLSGYRRVTTSPYFDVADIDVRGATHSDVHRLAEQAALEHGKNIFAIDPDRAERVFEASPWVERAHIDRQLPDTLVVELEEPDPGAILVGRGRVVVSEQGREIETLAGPIPEELFELPLVTGLAPGELDEKQGRRLMREALKVAELYETMGLDEGGEISEVHVDPVVGLTLTIGEEATEIRLGRGEYRRRLERLERVRRALADREVEPAYILMDHDDSLERITVGRRQRHGPRRGAPEGE